MCVRACLREFLYVRVTTCARVRGGNAPFARENGAVNCPAVTMQLRLSHGIMPFIVSAVTAVITFVISVSWGEEVARESWATSLGRLSARLQSQRLPVTRFSF